MKDDVISRNGVSAWLDNMGYPRLADVVMDEKRFPPAQPEQTWILCSEKLPEYGEAVLTVNEDGDYEVNHIIDEDNGEWFYEGTIAWMTLPPYKEG